MVAAPHGKATWLAMAGQDRAVTIDHMQQRASEPSDTEAPRDDDHTHMAKQPKQVLCMNFKASTTTKSLLLSLNCLL